MDLCPPVAPRDKQFTIAEIVERLGPERWPEQQIEGAKIIGELCDEDGSGESTKGFGIALESLLKHLQDQDTEPRVLRWVVFALVAMERGDPEGKILERVSHARLDEIEQKFPDPIKHGLLLRQVKCLRQRLSAA